MSDETAKSAASETPPPSPPSKPSSRLPWIIVLVLLVAVAAIAGVMIPRFQRQKTETELLALKANQVPANAKLFSYAVSIGEKEFGKNCQSCHGADLKGDPQKGVPNMTDDDWLYGGGLMGDLEQTISYGIRSGHPKAWNLANMPAYGSDNPHSVSLAEKMPTLNAMEISDLADYMLQQEKRPFDAAAATRGDALYQNKAGCFDCHGQDAGGDPAIGAPSLTDAIWLYGTGSKQDIMTSISSGHAGTCPAWIDKLGKLKVRGLAAYVKSKSKQSPYAVPEEELSTDKPPLPK
ncbi:MAG: c-type cytochrome [Caulobacteraceae bacterium]